MQLPKCVPKCSAVIAERVWEEGDTECWQWLLFSSMLAWHFLLTPRAGIMQHKGSYLAYTSHGHKRMVININRVKTRPRHLFMRACWSAKYAGNGEQFSSHQGTRGAFSWNWGELAEETRMQPKDSVKAVCTLRFFLQVTLSPLALPRAQQTV